MPNPDAILTRPATWNLNMAECKTDNEKIHFIRKAIQQHVEEGHTDGLRPPQVVVNAAPSGLQGEYLLKMHTISLQYDANKSCTDYMVVAEHEREHGKQRLSEREGGYKGQEGVMARISWAVYPNKYYTRGGTRIAENYAYNYNELRAVHASAQWLHNRYHARQNASPPDFFTGEKQEVLKAMKELRAYIQGRPSMRVALQVNRQNASKAFWGKFNPYYVGSMSGFAMSRFLRSTGKELIKEVMHDLKEIEAVLAKDIAELEQQLNPLNREETRRAEQAAIDTYRQDQVHEAAIEASAKGFDKITEYPTGSYSIVDIDNPRLLNYYMQAFSPKVQTFEKFQGKLHWMEEPNGRFKIFVPKDLLSGPEVNTYDIAPAQISAKEAEFKRDDEAWENADIEVK